MSTHSGPSLFPGSYESDGAIHDSKAPQRPLPSSAFYSVEYPGYVQPASVPLAVHNLGGQASLDVAFKRTALKRESLLELNFDAKNPFAHPIPGDVVGTNNILLKVVRRKRRRPRVNNEGNMIVGEYTAEVVGVIPKTVRFRSMADYQYQPDMDDPVSKLRLAMDQMDVDAIREFRISDQDIINQTDAQSWLQLDPALFGQENHTAPPTRSELRLFPPPVFSRQGIPQNYNFKANPSSMTTTVVDDEIGEEKKRLINRSRWKGYGPVTISFADPEIPADPSSNILGAHNQADQILLGRLRKHFEERPIWTRMSLFNQFSSAEARELLNTKVMLSLVCYVFHDGPWRDTLVRFGYDPRKDVGARIYQRLYFRNPNHPIERPSVITRRQEGRAGLFFSRSSEQDHVREEERRKSHIFDGITLTKETAAFQLCDIRDPLLHGFINEEEDLRELCHERDGWYSAHAFESIKTVLRHKFFSLLEGYIATDEECLALLEHEPGGGKKTSLHVRKLKSGKHNMAKGALPPEAAAARRLQATLSRNAKNFQASRRELSDHGLPPLDN